MFIISDYFNSCVHARLFSAHSAEIENAGGSAFPLEVDIRDEQQVDRAVADATEYFGGIDI